MARRRSRDDVGRSSRTFALLPEPLLEQVPRFDRFWKCNRRLRNDWMTPVDQEMFQSRRSRSEITWWFDRGPALRLTDVSSKANRNWMNPSLPANRFRSHVELVIWSQQAA